MTVVINVFIMTAAAIGQGCTPLMHC